MAKDKSEQETAGTVVVKGAALEGLTAKIKELEAEKIRLEAGWLKAANEARTFSADLEIARANLGAPGDVPLPAGSISALAEVLAILERVTPPPTKKSPLGVSDAYALEVGFELKAHLQAKLLAMVAIHLDLAGILASLLPVDPDTIAEHVRAVLAPQKPPADRSER